MINGVLSSLSVGLSVSKRSALQTQACDRKRRGEYSSISTCRGCLFKLGMITANIQPPSCPLLSPHTLTPTPPFLHSFFVSYFFTFCSSLRFSLCAVSFIVSFSFITFYPHSGFIYFLPFLYLHPPLQFSSCPSFLSFVGFNAFILHVLIPFLLIIHFLPFPRDLPYFPSLT